MDVCGPMSVPSLNGSKYFLTFIYDLSRMCWVYFLTHKIETAKRFEEFKKFVKNQARTSINCMMSDNGGEFTAHSFKF